MNGVVTMTTPTKMTRAEAKTSLRLMRGYDRQFWLELAEFLDREGWRALGYARASECLAVELARTVRTAQRLIVAARIAAEPSRAGRGEMHGLVPERQLRELARLDTDELRREVFAEATTDGDTTAAALRDLVDTRLEAAAEAAAIEVDDAREFATRDRGGQPQARSGCEWWARAVKHLEPVLRIVCKDDERCQRARPLIEQAAAILRGEA